MRGFPLLCLAGYILAASVALALKPGLHGILTWPPGATGPMENKEGFNTTSNSTTSMVPGRGGGNETSVQWNGTTQPIENNYGFPPPPADGENTKIIWHPFDNTDDFPLELALKDTKPTGHTVRTAKKPMTSPPEIVWHPFENTDDFPPESAEKDEETQK